MCCWSMAETFTRGTRDDEPDGCRGRELCREGDAIACCDGRSRAAICGGVQERSRSGNLYALDQGGFATVVGKRVRGCRQP